LKLIALQDLPNGVRAGGVYEEREGIGAFLLAKGLVRKAEPVDASEIPLRVGTSRYSRRVNSSARLPPEQLLDE
jgi:hypothetical protein